MNEKKLNELSAVLNMAITRGITKDHMRLLIIKGSKMRYPSKTLTKNVSPVARTVSEANRDAQYACAIQTFKSDAKLTLEFIGNALIGALWTTVFLGAVLGAVVFLTGWRF